MEVKINMLNVKDGDAIIVELIKPNKTLVIVIDCGNKDYYELKMKSKLKEVLDSHNKIAPDIVVCTHYDADHIGGLVPLVEEYISGIKEVWFHAIPGNIKKYLQESTNRTLDFSQISSIAPDFEHKINSDRILLNYKSKFILESLGDLSDLSKLIPPDKVRHVFHQDGYLLEEWPEIKILGPTKEYFDSLFPDNQPLKSFIEEESTIMLDNWIDMPKTVLLESTTAIAPCDKLKPNPSVTKVNRISIIFAIDKNDKRYLFTGDAGVKSFKSIPNYETELKDLYFLKVPHHGSNNNMTKELSELMNPEYAYCSGDTHQDDEVLECLQVKSRNKEVKTTKSDGDLYFDK